jgi:hypothetical protein
VVAKPPAAWNSCSFLPKTGVEQAWRRMAIRRHIIMPLALVSSNRNLCFGYHCWRLAGNNSSPSNSPSENSSEKVPALTLS